MFTIAHPDLLHDKEFDSVCDYREGTYELWLKQKVLLNSM